MDKDLKKVEELRKSAEVKNYIQKLKRVINQQREKFDSGESEEFHNFINLFHAVVVEGEFGPPGLPMEFHRIMANGMAMGYLLGKQEN
jgi:hypothetical protein